MSKVELPESQRVAADLRRKILAEELAPGASLPSEREFMEQYGIGKATVRKVVGILRAEGLVQSHKGRGTFVRKQEYVVRHGQNRFDRRHRRSGKAPFRAEVEAQGRTPRVDVKAIEVVPAEDWVRERLLLGPAAQVLKRTNIYYVDDEPVQYVISYFNAETTVGSPLELAVPGPGGIYEALEGLGHVLTKVGEEVSARMASEEERITLQLEPGTPVLDVIHVSYDQADEPFVLSHFVLSGYRNRLHYEHPVR